VPADASHLEIVERDDARIAARLSGDLDIVTSDAVRRELAQLIDDGHHALALNLSDVGFVDSSGLGVLVAIHRHAEAQGGSLVLQSVTPQVRRLFDITRLGDLLTVDSD
jgi:anti-sigma B factor antagonist